MGEIAIRTKAEETLVDHQSSIQQLIPPAKFKLFREFVANASIANADLNTASYQSITKAFMDCAKSGLMPDGKEAALVTRYVKAQNSHEATFQPMVKGVTRLINESQTIKSFHVKTVYEGDEFEMWSDETGDHLKCRPNFDVDRTDNNIKLFYACAVLDNNSVLIEVMTKKQVEQHKALAKQQYVWNQWFGEMGIKTIIHRIMKRLPIEMPEVMEGLESSLDIQLEKPRQKSPFKSKAELNRTIKSFASCIAEQDIETAIETYTELNNNEVMYLLGYLENNEFGGLDANISGVSFDAIKEHMLSIGNNHSS